MTRHFYVYWWHEVIAEKRHDIMCTFSPQDVCWKDNVSQWSKNQKVRKFSEKKIDILEEIRLPDV